MAVLFSLLSVVMLESVAIGDLLLAPKGPSGGFGSVSGREFNPSQAGGPIRNLTTNRVKITERGVGYVRNHLERFGGPFPWNDRMMYRLNSIVEGRIKPTKYDLNFYTHELRESVRYRRLGFKTGGGNDWDLWNNAHTATLEDYRIIEKINGRYQLYHPDAATYLP